MGVPTQRARDRDKFEELLPICALAALFTVDASAGRRILHDQLAALIRNHQDAFGDLRDLIRPFYHMVLYAPWAMQGYTGRPLSDYTLLERDVAHRLLSEFGCQSLSADLFCRDWEDFHRIEHQDVQGWVLADALLQGVVLHLAASIKRAHGIGIGHLDDEGGVWTGGTQPPPRYPAGAKQTLVALRRTGTVPRQHRLQLLQGGKL